MHIMGERAFTGDRARSAIDVPTIGLATGIYVAFGLVTWYAAALPWWLVMAAGGCLVCLHGSLQHEVVHGFPTRWRWLNVALIYPSLWLFVPYGLYCDSHLRHHRDERLTTPVEDPESWYVSAAQWAQMGPFHRRLRQVLNTLLGRLILGPIYVVWLTFWRLADRAAAGDRAYIAYWIEHVPAVAIVILWVTVVCGLSFSEYLLLFVYPGLALTLLRSFAEHRAAVAVAERTAIVESGRIVGLLYLYNNLHALHHAEPQTVWHQRPARYRQRQAELLAENGHYRMRGYRVLFGRYLLQAKEPVLHPFDPPPAGLPAAGAPAASLPATDLQAA
jgi:fatty acid desaturase